jgi:hypothetical protein
MTPRPVLVLGMLLAVAAALATRPACAQALHRLKAGEELGIRRQAGASPAILPQTPAATEARTPVAPAVPAARAADGSEDPSELCERAIVNGARRGGVPVEVLHAVALNETGRKDEGNLRAWPWAINREGKGYWFKSYEEALAFAKESLAAGRTSFDVGCVQINYRWHGHAFPSIEAMFDPEWTATYAAQFLRTLYEERGDWSAAAGAYHSLTPELARKYAARFATMLAGPAARTLDAAPSADALVAAVGGATSTRAGRREAQRRAIAERMRAAGPPAPPVNGGIAGGIAGTAQPLLVQGTPLLTPGQPLLAAPGGSLF